MRSHIVLVVALSWTLLAPLAQACQPINPLPSPQELVRSADVIVRAVAYGISEEPGEPGVIASDSLQVRFIVLEVLKGAFAEDSIAFNAGEPFAQGDKLTPYWSSLTPTNEQLFGLDDPWLQWVKGQSNAMQ